MAIDFLKSRFEQIIKDMMLAKENNVSRLQRYLATKLSENELRDYEIERIINNYEAVCGEYLKAGKKKLLKSINYLNRRLYSRLKPELVDLNMRLERISKKIFKLQRMLDE